MTMPAPSDHQPTADDLLGMAWFNSLTEWARGEWLRRAGSAVPADAWAAFKAATPRT